jgi:seryl-tRNA synthetase
MNGSENRVASIGTMLFQSTGGNGVYARTGLFEQVMEALSALITRERQADTEVLRFPPVVSRQLIEKSGYLHSFPHFLGFVSCLHNEHEAALGRAELRPTDLVLTPAACYPLYPLVAARGTVPETGLVFDVCSYCFRREVSENLDRLQTFQMREYVCIGTAEQAVAFRAHWMSRAQELAQELELPYQIAPATDPFFGKAGKLLAMSQIEQSLKFELLIPVLSEENPTACMSFNCHRDHFGKTWGMRTADGELAHTACVAFGLDRLALALFATHGPKLETWPAALRKLFRSENERTTPRKRVHNGPGAMNVNTAEWKGGSDADRNDRRP